MDYIRFHAALHSKSPAITDLVTGRRWNYGELHRQVAQCVALFINSGIGEGQRVACIAKNCAEQVILHTACARVGAIYVPLNWRLSVAEIKQLLDDCSPSLIFGDELADTMERQVEPIAALIEQSEHYAPVWGEQSSVDIASLILYTSGTTGAPKGVMLSERNLTETAINFGLLGEVDSSSNFLCESPMFHIIGMVTSIRPALLQGAQITISDKFIPERTLARLADPELKISHYFCVPQMALALRAADNFNPEDLRGLTALFTGGAPHREMQIREWLDDGISIVDGYGMSETGTVFGMPLDRELIDKDAGCVGIATPRIQARIVDDFNQPVATGVAGELQLKGDNITLGYWQKEDVFQKTLTEDGWFKTGDILSVDAAGVYRVTDRKKDMFISGGENVYPAEVENLMLGYPGIKELAVVGVPDEKWGEVGCLFYVSEGQTISEDEVLQYLKPNLAKYKIPQRTQEIDAIPRNGVGKTLKHELRKLLQNSAT